jgi:thermitase
MTIEYADVELLVDLADVDLEDLEMVVAKFDGTVSRAFSVAEGDITDLDEFYLIDLPGLARPNQIRKLTTELTRKGLIDWAEANERVSLSPVETEIHQSSTVISNKLVNDPDVSKQWSFQALEVADLHTVLSLKTVTPKKTALIAILDTGIDGRHEDLIASYQSTQEKYDLDIQGHGTHVAGIAAAVSNNHIGIASFDPSHSFVRVTSIKVLSDQGFGSQANIVQGMIEAADLGADVISMSLGSRSNSERELTYEKTVKYCNDKGAVVVVAAGNASTNAKFYSPANVKGVIAVSAVNRSLQKTSFSNSVSEIKYGIAAPGDEIYSTFPKNQYRALRGTSMACPHVASLVGILKSLDPDLNTAEIHQLLEKTGRVGKQSKEAGNIIQPAAAIRALLD